MLTAEKSKRICEKFKRNASSDKIVGMTFNLLSENADEQVCIGETSKNSNRSINNDTLFEIGSLTKPIIASLYSIFESRKSIDLQKSISFYLEARYSMNPIFKFFKIEDILTHCSGLPRLPSGFLSKMENTVDPYSVLTMKDLESFFREPEGISKPGRYKYSNLGYGILGEILKTVFGKNLDELCTEYLFQGVNMNRTGTIRKFEQDDNKATGYTYKNQETAFWTGDILDGAGCFLSTNNDMSTFLKLNLGHYDTPVTEAIMKTHILRTKKTGLSWHHKNGIFARMLGYSGFIWHNGMTGGFSSYMAFNKEKNTGINLMANKAYPLASYFYYYSSFVR